MAFLTSMNCRIFFFFLISLLVQVGHSAVAQNSSVKRSAIPQTATSGMANPVSQPRAPRPVDFSIRAVDETSKADIPAVYEVRAMLANRTFKGNSKAGQPFSFVLTRTDTLVVKTGAKGYYNTEETLLVSCDTCGTYEHLAVMERVDTVFTNLKLNETIRLDNVYFDQSSYVLRPESSEQLDKLLKTLKSNPGLSIEIAGHTDNVGDRRLNQALSENRAKIITNYLITRGIAQSRLQPRGYGDLRPVAPNDTEDNKKKNRRVEFVVLKL